MVVDEHGVRLQRYFCWPDLVEERWSQPSDCVERFRELLARAVRDRLRAPRIAVYMSGGVDSPLVALTAKRELARRFHSPALEAFCLVYDHLIPDDERRFAEIAARSLSIPLDVQACDDGALLDWVGRIRPADPGVMHALGPQLDQMARIARRFPAILTGNDGDTLLASAVRLHWRERLADRRLGLLGRELAWYVARQRALPPVGARTFLAARRARGTKSVRRPSWLREDFWRRASLEARWASIRRSPRVDAFQTSAPDQLGDGIDAVRRLGARADLRREPVEAFA